MVENNFERIICIKFKNLNGFFQQNLKVAAIHIVKNFGITDQSFGALGDPNLVCKFGYVI